MFYKILKNIIISLERHNKLLLIIGLGAFLLAFIIYYNIFDLNWYKSIYYAIIQFFGGITNPSSIGMIKEPHNWELIYISGFLSLLTTTLLIIVKFSKDFIFEKVREIIVKDSKEHIIICGLGLNNRYIINSILEKQQNSNSKQEIIIIEKYSDNHYIDEYRLKEQCSVIIKDAAEKEVLEYAGVATAEYIIISTGSDYLNLSIANNIRLVNKNIRVYVHIEDNIIERNYKRLLHEKSDVFSYNENSVRDLFSNKMILSQNIDTVNGNDQVHILVIGFGSLGEKCVINAIELGHFYNGKKLKITIVDKDITRWHKFERHYCYKDIEDIDVHFENIDFNSLDFDKKIIQNFSSITNVIITLDDDNKTMTLLSDLVNKVKQTNTLFNKDSHTLVPIAVRFKLETSIDLKQIDASIIKFGETSKSSNIDFIINSTLDTKAKELHEKYNKENPLYSEEWSEINDEKKDKNRAAADSSVIKEYTILKLQEKYPNLQEYIIKDKTDSSHLKFEELPEVMQKLIDMEHRRWNAYHIMQGWKNGPTRDDKHKIHICIVKTQSLEEVAKRQKEYNEEFNTDYYINDLNSWKAVYEELQKKEHNV